MQNGRESPGRFHFTRFVFRKRSSAAQARDHRSHLFFTAEFATDALQRLRERHAIVCTHRRMPNLAACTR
jgi:hypothetical protein